MFHRTWQQQVYTNCPICRLPIVYLSSLPIIHLWWHYTPGCCWSTFAFPSSFSSTALRRRWVCSSVVISVTFDNPSSTLHHTSHGDKTTEPLRRHNRHSPTSKQPKAELYNTCTQNKHDNDTKTPDKHILSRLHCVQKKTPTHIFFHISMSDV